MKSNMMASPSYDVYDIDGTITRPGHDLWYLTTKALIVKEEQGAFDNRVKRWKKQVDETGDVVQASEDMLEDAIHMIPAEFSSEDVFQQAKSIAGDLIEQGVVFAEWVSFVKKRISEGVIPVLATTNYIEGAQAFVLALLAAKWITKEEADKFLVSGTKVDWIDRTILHFNMHSNKAIGVLQVTNKSCLRELEKAVKNVFGDDPLGNDYDLIMLAGKNDDYDSNAWVVSTAKNASLDLPPIMQRMSWLHWRDTENHRMPVGLMNVFDMSISRKRKTVVMEDISESADTMSSALTGTAGPVMLTPSLTEVPQVVVVGGGFCGVVVARLLQSHVSMCDVTLIDPKPYFEYVGALPKSLLSEKFSRVPLATALPHTSIIQGWVESVGESHVTLSMDGEGSHPVNVNINFDHLVLATGSNYPSGVKYSHDVSGVSRSTDLKQQKTKVLTSNKILIVGGGLVGVEIATEIKYCYPSKHVIIVDRNPRLFPRILGAHELVLQRLQQLQVEVFLNQELTRMDPDTQEYATKSGQKFQVDHAIWCGGPQPNATLVPSVNNAFPAFDENTRHSTATTIASNKSSYLQADEFLNLKGSHGKVWCGGDICQTSSIGEEATASRAIEQGTIIAHNILQSLKQNKANQNGQHDKVQLALYEERCSSCSGAKKADIPSMIVSLGGKRALVVIDNIPVEGPFRHLKEQVENLFLSQISMGANSGRLQDPYALLNKVDSRRLEDYAHKNIEPTLRDLLTPEVPHLVRDTMNCFVPRPVSHRDLHP